MITATTVSSEVLFNIVNSAVGLLGYFDYRPTSVEIVPGGGFIVHWDHWGNPAQLPLDANGHVIPRENRSN